MENLHVLNIMGNPVRKGMSNYRKTMIVRCRNLTYLDDRPVRDKERACAEAWHRGGREEERAERDRWNAADRAQQQASVDYLIGLRRKNEAGVESGTSRLCSYARTTRTTRHPPGHTLLAIATCPNPSSNRN